ncbi:MAG: low affinity iron permease family protein [Terriglobales bacterium]
MTDNAHSAAHKKTDSQGFQTLAKRASFVVGSKWAFLAATMVVIAWCISGPYFHYSDTWQLVINTSTTIITFLMVFLIQNTQNRDARAIHLKLDEIIHSIKLAHNDMMSIENLTDAELEAVSKRFETMRELHESRRKKAGVRETP